jgi:hypothetical protein
MKPSFDAIYSELLESNSINTRKRTHYRKVSVTTVSQIIRHNLYNPRSFENAIIKGKNTIPMFHPSKV